MKELNVEIWTINLEVSPDLLSIYLADLNTDEIVRLERYRREIDRTNFIVSRAVLKRLIASKLSINTSDVVFEENQFGKPRIIQNYPLQFNLSHSGKLAIIGFTENHRIGVDVEYMKDDIEYEKIARHHFAPEELEVLIEQPMDQLRDYFYRCWTRKESFIKAEGSGVSYPLDSFIVSMHSDDEAAILNFKDSSENQSEWSMHSFIPAENYIAAVTANSGSSNLVRKTWDHSESVK